MAKKILSDNGAERAVLAGLFTYGLDSYVEISDLVSTRSFNHYGNQILYKCVESIIQNGASVDLPSILSTGKQLGFESVLTKKEELENIAELMKFPIKKDNVPRFAVQLKKYEYARQIQGIAKAISDEVNEISGAESIDDIFGMVENPVMDFLNQDTGAQKPVELGEGIDEYYDFLLANRCDQIGIATGMPRFDASIGGGPRRGGVSLIAARPKTGKSVFADNVAVHVGKNIPILMLDTEMRKNDHIHRIAANLGNVSLNLIETGKFGDTIEDRQAVRTAFSKIKELKYTYASVAGMPFPSIMNIIKKWIIQKVGYDENGKVNDCLVIYDYLKLMTSDSITSNIAEFQALGFQITDLHNLSVKYDFPVLAFVQLNREGITKESSGAISGSDRLVWLCTSFSIFKKKSPEEFADDGPLAGNRKLVPVDCRHGPGMEDGNYINMGMTGDKSQLIELRTRDELKAQQSNQGAIEGANIPFDLDPDEDDDENEEED